VAIKNISLKLPADLLQKLDEASLATFTNRSSYIRRALIEKLHADGRFASQTQPKTQGEEPKEQPTEPDNPDDDIYRKAGFANFEEFKKYIDRPASEYEPEYWKHMPGS
jgi:hypothetical protein